MPQMNILNAVEREALDSPPVFNSFQRKQYFDFPSKLRRFAAGLRNPGLPAWLFTLVAARLSLHELHPGFP